MMSQSQPAAAGLPDVPESGKQGLLAAPSSSSAAAPMDGSGGATSSSTAPPLSGPRSAAAAPTPTGAKLAMVEGPGPSAAHLASPSVAFVPEPGGRRPWTCRRLCSWAGALVPIFAIHGVLVASGVSLLINGGGEGSAFRCDVAAATFSLVSAGVLCILVVLGCLCERRKAGKREMPWRRWEQDCRIFMEVNAAGFLMFALLAHKPAYLVQLLAVLFMSCWVAFSCSLSAWAWRKGVAAEIDGGGCELNAPLLEVLLSLPRWRLALAWLVICGASWSVMYFKPRHQLGFDEKLERIEHFLFTSLGGLFISAFLSFLGLWLLSAGRRLLIFRRWEGYGWEAPPEGIDAILRALIVSFGCHFFAAAFFPFLGYAMVTGVILLMAKAALRGARSPEKKKAKKKDDDDDQPTQYDKDGKPLPKPRRKKNKKMTLKKRIIKYALMIGIFVFGVAKVALMFVAFLFDVVFVQKCLAGMTSARFALIKNDFACGQHRTYVGDFKTIDLCARHIKEVQGKTAFMYGTNATNSVKCYMEEQLVVDREVWETFTHDTVRYCPDEDGQWISTPGLNFYAIQPDSACGLIPVRRLSPSLPISSRRLAELQVLDEDKKEDKYSTVDQIPAGIANVFKKIHLGGFGDAIGDGVSAVMKFLKGAMDLNPGIPSDVLFKCTGLRRLISATMVLGAVTSMLVVMVIDVISVLSATSEIAIVRGQTECDGFLAYAMMRGRAQLIEQVVLMILQVTINSASHFKREVVGLFRNECGYLAKPDLHHSYGMCKNVWAGPVDFLAIAVLVFAMICGFLLVLAVFAGLFYGMAPARWAIIALFGKDLALSRFGHDEDSIAAPDAEDDINTKRSQNFAHPTLAKKKTLGELLLQPGMGLLTSLGIWTTWSSKGYQIGQRQDWYEPLDAVEKARAYAEAKKNAEMGGPALGAPGASEAAYSLYGSERWDPKYGSEGAPFASEAHVPRHNESGELVVEAVVSGDSGELVGWKSMYQSTSKSIAMAWLPLPYGNLFSKGTLYLNEYVIFAFGKDGGGSMEEPERIKHHFMMDNPQGVMVMNWCTYACQFAILVIINFDLLGNSNEKRLGVLTGCIVVVVGVAVLRVGMDLVKELTVFTMTKGVAGQLSLIVEAGVVPMISRGESVPDDEDEFGVNLAGLCDQHKEKVRKACKDLIELEWILAENPTLPKHAKTLLGSSKSRKSKRTQVAQRLLKAQVVDNKVTEGMVTAALILLLHEVVNSSIQQSRAIKAAKREAKGRLRDATESKGRELQQWAEISAKDDALQEAVARIRLYDTVMEIVAERRRRGLPVVELPPPTRWLAVKFSAVAQCTSSVAAQWSKGNRELIDPQKASAIVTVRGEVHLTWPAEQRCDELAITDVTVVDVSHQIDPPIMFAADGLGSNPKGAEAGGSPAHALIRPSQMGDGCELCGFESQAMSGSGGCCSNPAGADHHDLEGAEEAWILAPRGVAWTVPSDSHNHTPSGRPDDSSPDNTQDSPGGGETGNASSKNLNSKGDSSGTASLLSDGTETFVRRRFPEDGTAWVHEVSPAPALRSKLTDSIMNGYAASMEGLESLEDELIQSVSKTPEWLAATFLESLGSRAGGEAARHQRANALLAKAIRRRMLAKEEKAAAQSPSPNQRSLKKQKTLTVERVETLTQDDQAADRHSEFLEQATSPNDTRVRALHDLRTALFRDPPDADELSLALDVARRVDVDPLVLQKAEELFVDIVNKQKAAFVLLQAMESRMIKGLRRAIGSAQQAGMMLGEFPDAKGVGVLDLANKMLTEEEENARAALQSALDGGGALKLLRAVEQGREAELSDSDLLQKATDMLQQIAQRKHDIALLKMAMATNNVGLLKAAIEECEKHGETGGKIVDLDRAKRKLGEIQGVADKLKGLRGRTPPLNSNLSDVPPAAAWNQWAHPEQPDASQVAAQAAMKQFRSNASLRAALFQDPPDCELLRLAISQARSAGVDTPDFARAEALLTQEDAKEHLLEELRAGAASREMGDIAASINHCRELGVDSRKLLFAISQLIEEQAKVSRFAADRGIGNVVLGNLERERRDLHNQVQEAHGGLRVICRVRPLLLPEKNIIPENSVSPSLPKSSTDQCSDREFHDFSASSASNSLSPARAGGRNRHRKQPQAVTRVDKHTLTIRSQAQDETFRVGAVFGPDCIQAEVWSEIRGLVQSAVDGYNISIIACGPHQSGKTFTMLGGSSEGRGMVPRVVDELFAIRSRDSWRATLEVDVQIFEIYNASEQIDLLGGRGRKQATARKSQMAWTKQQSKTKDMDNAMAMGKTKSMPTGVRRSPTAAWGIESESPEVESMVTRRISEKHELRQLVDQAWANPTHPELSRHVVLQLHITRTNQATGTATKSRLSLVDLAGMGQRASEDVKEAYNALEEVLKALAMQERRVPFQKHVLTQVLQECMGGNAKTVLMLSLPPTAADVEDSLASIEFVSCGSW